VKLLADASIWIDHIRAADEVLTRLLRHGMILTHPFVIGEIAMGSIARRAETLFALARLPQAAPADHLEVMDLVERHRLFGTGIGLIDAHLLASALLTPETRLWTRDRRLADAAERLGVGAEAPPTG
jgi:predicted nucleic acid-binding protein